MWYVVLFKIITLVMLFMILDDILSIIWVDHLLGVCLTTSLKPSIWLAIDTSEFVWLNSKRVLTS